MQMLLQAVMTGRGPLYAAGVDLSGLDLAVMAGAILTGAKRF